MDDAATAPLTAPERLRAFEDATFGEDVVRIRGQIERGYGSKFKEMKPEQHRHYAALEKLVAAEQKLADAKAAHLQAQADHEASLAQVAAIEAKTGPTVEEWVAAGYRASNYPPRGYASRSTPEEIAAAIAAEANGSA